ncbi:salicylate hydroxylase [Pseudohyphozyma bogoriensis]|nr:salicylate hydroxylase [Pseudohyphozyma bogoriensis]
MPFTLPPLGVFLERGCNADFWINILLTILGYLPGIIHALYVTSKLRRFPDSDGGPLAETEGNPDKDRIAGLACAVGLVNQQKDEGANIEVRIYESAAKFGEIGAGVSFGPNSIKALRLLGAGECLERFLEGDEDPNTWFDFFVGDVDHPKSGEFICSVKSNPNLPDVTENVHRADFLDELVKLLPPSVALFGHRVTSYTPHSTGITLSFTNNTTTEADIVIACDGIKSVLRREMYSRVPGLRVEDQVAKYSEWIAWRGMITREEFERAMGKEAKTKMMHLGEGRHILHFPVRGGELINIVAFVNDPEHLKLKGRTGPWAESGEQAELLEDYAGFNEACLELLKAIHEPSIWGIFALPPIETISDERIVLIGDAAFGICYRHAMTPHQGAGAGQAIEDGLFISSILSSPAITNAPLSDRATKIQSAINAYVQVRHPRGEKVQSTSRENGLLYNFKGVNGEGSDVEKIKQTLAHRLEWIWEYDTEKALKETLAAL